MKKLIIFLLILSMLMPYAASASAIEPQIRLISEADYEAVDQMWQILFAAEKKSCADAETAQSVAAAVEKNELYVENTLRWNGDDHFTFETTTGVTCGYSARLRNIALHAETNEAAMQEPEIQTISYSQKNTASSLDVYLIEPYYGIDDNFTKQYQNEAKSIAQSTGGNYQLYAKNAATIDAVADAMESGAVVIFDSHGDTDFARGTDYTSGATTSYLLLQTGNGLTDEDYKNDNGTYHAVNYGGDGWGMYYYAVDGTCIANHMESDAPNSLLWMAICLGMATDGLYAPLREKGVEVAYGYSQSVTFHYDYQWEEVFYSELKAGSNVATAVAKMKSEVGYWDWCHEDTTISDARAYDDAFPIVVSSEDVYPGHGNVDNLQKVYSTWTLPNEENIESTEETTVTEPSEESSETEPTEESTVCPPDCPVPPIEYVAIYSEANGKVMTTEINTYIRPSGLTMDQLISADATLNEEGMLETEADNVALFSIQAIDDYGTVVFVTPDFKYLSCDGMNLAFVDEINENTEFVLEEVEDGYLIRLANYLYNGEKEQYIEFYRDHFTVYGLSPYALENYTFKFCEVKGIDLEPTETEPTVESSETEPTEESSETEPTEESSETEPSEEPSETEPSEEPSETEPSEEPSETEPSEEPSETEPSEEPSETEPTEEPSETEPSEESSEAEPSEEPSETEPSEEPSETEPSEEPSEEPTIEYEGFDDVSESAWFYNNVVFAVEQGLMNGVGDRAFAPNGSVTRAMLVTILYRNENEPSIEGLNNPFADVKEDQWYTDAIIWAANQGIVKGMSATSYEPDTAITREQIAAILYRYAGFKGEEIEDYGNAALDSFADSNKVSSYAVSAIKWAVGAGIINGMDGKLAANATATRAQLAAMLQRYLAL